MGSRVSYILATAGHVDHGKTALVRALTGVDTDRLPEEKARGITIDLGLRRRRPADAGRRTVRLGVVDVPGHEDFVKNMVAGIGSVDLALLVVAADDGWMPQTEEHLQILAYQGVARGVVAVTKVDLATDEDATVGEVRRRLVGSCLADAAVVPTSVVTRPGIDDLRAALVAAVVAGRRRRGTSASRGCRSTGRSPSRGVGTVVTGTLTGGSLSRGQAVVARPGALAGKVRSVQRHNRDAATVPPGSRVAVSVPELAKVARGVVVTGPKLGDVTDTLDVVLERSARTDPRPLPHAARVWVHHGTAAVPGRVYWLDRERPALAQVRLETPVCGWLGDRLVIRDWPQQHTLAGGVVLDLRPGRRAYNTAGRGAALERRRALGRDDAAGWVVAEVVDRGAVPRAAVLLQSWFSAADVEAAVGVVLADGRAVAAGGYLVGADRWRAWVDRAAAAVDAEHRRPAGARRAGRWPTSGRRRRRRAGPGGWSRRGRGGTGRPRLPADRGDGRPGRRTGRRCRRSLAAAGGRVRAALSAKPMEPPNRTGS